MTITIDDLIRAGMPREYILLPNHIAALLRGEKFDPKVVPPPLDNWGEVYLALKDLSQREPRRLHRHLWAFWLKRDV